MMRLAGEIADIALVGGRYLSPSLAANYRAFIAEGAQRVGRDVASVEVAPRVTLCVSSDGDLARRSEALCGALHRAHSACRIERANGARCRLVFAC